MSEDLDQHDGTGGKHGAARALAERALLAEAAGDQDEADRLFAEAERADPQAVEAILLQHADDPEAATALPPAPDDDAIEAMSRTIEPDASPPRAGVSGRGSGADNQQT